MNTKSNKGLIIFSFIFYIAAVAAMIFGSFNDLQINLKIFNPENTFAHLAEQFSQFVYWGIWGPALTIVFLCRRNLNESLGVINKVFPFIKPFGNTETTLYKVLNTILNVILTLGYFVLAVVGWKKLIENIIKNILKEMGREDLPQFIYFAVCAFVAAAAIFLCSKIDKQKLRKLEGLALAGILLGIFSKILEECKEITGRVRFREMVAYSNGFIDEDGLSDATHSPLTKAMADSTDFSAFTAWYKKGDDMGIYDHSNSFPSGHTTYCCSMFLTYILCKAYDKLKKLAPFALFFSAAYVIVIAATRMIAGAHYLTDVAGAAIIGYSFFLIVYKLYNTFTKKGIIG